MRGEFSPGYPSFCTPQPHSQPARARWHILLIVATVALAVEAIFACCVGLDRPLRADEPHFVKTIIRFGTTPLSLDLLTHYDAMSGPLPFMLYGAWGRLFGFEPHTLRLFSILVAVATYVLWFWFLHTGSGNLRLAVLGTAFVSLHPYMIYLSLFIYTDMLAILCLIGALIAIRRERPGWLALALCCGMLNRQYLVFATLAAGAYWALRYVRLRQHAARKHLLAVTISAVPLAGLCWLWGGLCPDGVLKHVYPDPHPTFHFGSLFLYISLSALYLAPVLALRELSQLQVGQPSRPSRYSRKSLVFASVCCWAYWLSPVAPSRSAVDAGTFHVGMLHQALARLSGGDLLPQCVFFAGFAFGLVIMAELLFDAVGRWRAGRFDFQFSLDLLVFAFLAVMPWSYLHWEKYLMPLLPVLVLRILFVPFPETVRVSLAPIHTDLKINLRQSDESLALSVSEES